MTGIRIKCPGEETMTEKPKMELVDLNFVAAIADCLDVGNQKDGRTPGDWQVRDKPIWTKVGRHSAKILRHTQGVQHATTTEELMGHVAAIGANAMILWCLMQREEKSDD